MALGAPPNKQQRRRPALAKPEWGAKRVCQNCGTKFYDFRRDPILCPSCGATYQPDDALKPRRSRVEPKGRAAAKPAPIEEEEVADEEEEGDDILLDEAEEEEDEVEEAVVEDEEDEEPDAEVKGGKPKRDPLIPDDEVEDDDALDEEIDEDDLDEEDIDEEFEDEEKEP
jgi:uncharacterized protein (TIGR02300 family)